MSKRSESKLSTASTPLCVVTAAVLSTRAAGTRPIFDGPMAPSTTLSASRAFGTFASRDSRTSFGPTLLGLQAVSGQRTRLDALAVDELRPLCDIDGLVGDGRP